jgi:hypothetical protein
LTYKSELLAAMTQCTESFLNSKDIDIFSDVDYYGMLPNHIVPITENDPSTNLISQNTDG